MTISWLAYLATPSLAAICLNLICLIELPW